MTIVTICWNWAQALNHTVILENVTRAQRICIRIMIFHSIHTNERTTHTCMPSVRQNAMHLENIDVDISIDQIQIWARAVFPWLYGLIFAYTTLVTNNTSGQTKHQKSHTSILLWKSDVQYTVIVLQCCCLQPWFNLALHVNVERLLVLARFLVNSHNQNYPIDRTETVHQT